MAIPSIDRFMTREPYAVSSWETLARVRQLMERHAVRHLPVIDDAELLGVISERELRVIDGIPGLKPEHVLVSRVMAPAVSVSANVPVDEAFQMMREQKVDCVVVRGPVGVMGIFTASDALEALASLGPDVAA